MKRRATFAAVCAGVLIGCGVTQAAGLAQTSFEASEGYAAPPPAYDVRGLSAGDGTGWGGNTWAGTNGGSAYTYVASDATAFNGSQYMVMHREKGGSANREIILRRKFNNNLIQDQRIILSLAFRLDAVRTQPDYFDSAFNLYLERATSNNMGDENVRLEFTKEGDVKVREDGTSAIVGRWDQPGAFYALNTWATVTLDVDIAAQRADFYMNGTFVGNYLFNKAGTLLDQIRFKGPRAYDGSPNDGASIDAIVMKTGLDEPAPGCKSSVRPGEPVSAVANIGEPAAPSSFEYAILNLGSVSLDYTATEVDANGDPADYGWLTLDKAGGTIASLNEDTVTASINTAGLGGGTHTAYIKIADNCNPQGVQLRRIDLTIIACEWTVDSCDQVRVHNLAYPHAPVEPVTYRITNTGLHPMSYSVAKSGGSCFEWLTLSGEAGALNPGEHADVTATIHPEALAGQPTDNSYTCTLTFTDGCSEQVITRAVRIRYLGIGDTQVFGYNGHVDPEADDAAGAGLKFQIAEGEANGAWELDNEAEDGQVWRILDPDDQKIKYQLVRWRESSQSWEEANIYSEAGATILGRLRVRSWGPTSNEERRDGGLYIWETDSISATLHWGGATDGMLVERNRSNAPKIALTPTDQFLTFRMTVIGREGDSWDCGRIVRIYVDENPTPVLEVINAGEEGNSREGFGFGAGSTNGTYDIAFDWVAGTNAGAFAPGEEVAVLGHSLIPSMCPRPFADADGDGDVDQEDFGVWQTCYTGFGAAGGYDLLRCYCFDRDNDNDIDSDDLGAFQYCISGPTIPANPACGDPLAQ